MPVDGLGDRRAAVADQVADVSMRTPWADRMETKEWRSSLM
jgi:hypothetical protein